MFDILIKNGQIVDGSGASAYYADLAVIDGKIVKIAPSIGEDAAKVIDAKGCQVTPGFIDNHSHSDESVFTGSNSYNYLEQGVTTQIAGQCGDSPAPYYEGAFDGYKASLSEEEFDKIVEISAKPSSFMAAAEKQSFGTNYAFFVGHGSLRGKAMGYSGDRANAKQMNVMKEMLEDAMEAGFLGFSTGLVYAPSVYGDIEELAELARSMKPYNGIYASHIRGEGNNVLRS
ncbi:MAG: amidohydrolase family protein, partial [Clostridia bacterium]|nr:amidohydrolase family protein [Clostridia bacterium]